MAETVVVAIKSEGETLLKSQFQVYSHRQRDINGHLDRLPTTVLDAELMKLDTHAHK